MVCVQFLTSLTWFVARAPETGRGSGGGGEAEGEGGSSEEPSAG